MKTREQAEQDLRDWATNNARRDDLVRAARLAGLSKLRIHELTGIARTTIDRILPKETTMAPRTNTSYGTWTNRVERYSANLATTVVEALGDYGDDYDVDALTAAYRDAINDALPAEVTLAGDEFLGPAKPDTDEWEGYPTDDLGQLDIKAIVDGVDFWAIAEKYETSGS
ncbi:hypothetical protein [Actinomadura luteofluorescens]|uniref:hypothetical protein n=1 Tax=Actinomadura luteofluorescens TaxID=46163 RepID=UPI003D919785